ncbi:hypothetical protein L873DRAFT_1805485 [Choiromyces venosus 120613-1]|uniref:Uncharacterized protein n=1 Tax=Choiromyces venosus 120613-1 TaxID=1336337 RepID=A0A3N4JSV9_9PEZI|nr:hypothetical protein L873DRAFT_1805485 [Choiromyces venosus 120613-1]
MNGFQDSSGLLLFDAERNKSGPNRKDKESTASCTRKGTRQSMPDRKKEKRKQKKRKRSLCLVRLSHPSPSGVVIRGVRGCLSYIVLPVERLICLSDESINWIHCQGCRE